MRSRAARIVAAATVAVTPLTACSDDATRQFIEAADEACRTADERLEEIELPSAPDGLERYVAKVKRISADLVADLRELDPPARGDQRVDQMIDGIERAADLLDDVPAAVVDRNRGAIADLQQELEAITDEVREIARSYGFRTCGAKLPGARP